MNAFIYGTILQLRLDIRSRSLLVTCYLVPLLFFLLMGGIFTSVMPDMRESLIPSMVIMGVSMGACIGLPPSVAETYGSDIKKMYQANRIPVYFGLAAMCISAFIHLMIVCAVIYLTAPLLFDASWPKNPALFFAAAAVYILASLSVGSLLGLSVTNQARLTMYEQIIFLPSILLSGIMFPASLLPDALQAAGKIFPAAWGYRLMANQDFTFDNLWYLLLVTIICAVLSVVLSKKPRYA